MGDFGKGSRRDSGSRHSGGFNRDFGQRDFGGEREMHKAVCAECGQECEVPFKPTEGRPVFCKECFRAKKRF